MGIHWKWDETAQCYRARAALTCHRHRSTDWVWRWLVKNTQCTRTNMFKMLNTITAWWHSQRSLEWYTYLDRFWGASPWKMKVIHSVLSSSDVGRKWRLLCSALHPNTEHGDCCETLLMLQLLERGKNGGQRTTADGRSYSDAGLSITPVFSVTWSFRSHSNMLICC